MTLDEFCSKGWRDHGSDASGVMARLPEGVDLVTSTGDIPKLAGLIVHVAGEHLGRWADGIALLERLRGNASFDAAAPEGKSLLRSLAILHASAGDADTAEQFTRAGITAPGTTEQGERSRIQAVIATNLTGQGRIAEAARALDEALRLASYGPGPQDPTARMLAMTGNNLACALEERDTLSADEVALMLRAAETGRKYWEIAGTWMETERAEYRLALSSIKAGDTARAQGHAAECLRIVRENGSIPGELFFAHEACGRAALAAGNRESAQAHVREAEVVLPTIKDEGFRSYCAGELQKLGAAVAGG